MSPRHIAAALLTVLLWGLNHVVAKVGVEASAPFWFVGVRLVLVGILVAPFVTLPRGRWPGIALLSFVYGALHLGLINFGLAGIDAATSVIIVQLGAPFTILLGRFVFKETFGRWRWAGIALAFLGIGLLAGEPRIDAPIYFIASVAAMAVWGVANVIIKRLDDVSPLTISAWSSLLAAPQILLASALLESGQMNVFTAPTADFWLMALYSAVASSIIAHTLWNGLLHRYPMATVAPFNLLVPLVGFAAAIIFLGEPVTDEKIYGGVLTFAGVALIQVRMIVKRFMSKDAARAPTV
ncbi:MAG: EamA family transporter [Rhodospirillaceae bacterium]|nr:EamA family transporter [Rhodospirillaceae bacterium]